MGMGYALTEDIEYTGGNIKTENFDTYEIPRFSWVPKIETYVLDRNEPPQGGGEPAIICMGGVIANAIHDATSARLYQMPMTPERVLEAFAACLAGRRDPHTASESLVGLAPQGFADGHWRGAAGITPMRQAI